METTYEAPEKRMVGEFAISATNIMTRNYSLNIGNMPGDNTMMKKTTKAKEIVITSVKDGVNNFTEDVTKLGKICCYGLVGYAYGYWNIVGAQIELANEYRKAMTNQIEKVYL